MASSSNGTKSPPTQVQRTKVLLLGQRRSGKTSIQQVLFNDVPPKQTFYLEPTARIVKHVYDTVIPLEIWDCPGTTTIDTLGAPLAEFSSIIFVIDIQDSYQQPVARMLDFFIAAYQESPDISLEVFVHKAEAFTEDYKLENFRHIQQRVIDELLDISSDYEQMPLNFYLTSVYDHSTHEAFSRVLHKLIDSLPYLEDMLNVFCANSQASKAFLFDVKSRLYVATDASPVDAGTHNLCCDYLKTLNAFGPLYKSSSASPLRLTASSPSSPPKPTFYPSAAVTLAPSTQGTTLTYHLITPQLALLTLMQTAVFEDRRGLLEYNVVFFREGVQEISQVETDARTGTS
ncbi:Gtr1/RagA G protein Gtr2 [Auriscalpium vulgare]|uniref:Gtr1/RagA G protein Gtr2 n=1 Tax=Auriscalpium vulgare TaxID=40419 RepID=A0ACB8RSJ8_9AGAM|nr:Gtr1/RagA G protein Gtr2 [Auriscalpium vulgare]